MTHTSQPEPDFIFADGKRVLFDYADLAHNTVLVSVELLLELLTEVDEARVAKVTGETA